jgi:hypothetical protein
MIVPWWLVALLAAKLGDTITTEQLLGRGGAELNWFMREEGARYAATIAGPIAVELCARKLERHGHKKVALWIRIGAIAAWSFAAANNLRLERGRAP